LNNRTIEVRSFGNGSEAGNPHLGKALTKERQGRQGGGKTQVSNCLWRARLCLGSKFQIPRKRDGVLGSGFSDENYELLIDAAYEEFCLNLEKFRKIYPVQTICMHGSPLSGFDNKDIWKKYKYKESGIIGEPYYDINPDEIFYITDTGRSWNNKSSRRDWMEVKNEQFKSLGYHSTFDIIRAVNQGSFPNKSMLTFHPQRWTNNPFLWTKELIWQNVKNVVKKQFYGRG
jgi:hypothetical protein